jgi:NhaA family Na+:H+ antiporter
MNEFHNQKIATMTIVTRLYNEFFNSEKTGGLILIICTVASVILANSPVQTDYTGFWNTYVFDHSLVHWINDGLMTVFFLLIGLELEREIYRGELADLKNAALPVLGALGGILFPAGIFLAVNYGTIFQSGAGIPMATDIAFAIGILSILGKRVPPALEIFLTALAVIDDLGAIMVITIFYTTTLNLIHLLISLGIFALLVLLNRLKVNSLIPYLIGGMAMWYFMWHSGVHATITGVLLSFAIPFGDGGQKSPSAVLQHRLHKLVAFFILPLFAMANTAIPLAGNWQSGLVQTGSIGIVAGLLLGKPLGIFLFSWLGARLGLCSLSPDIRWKNILGVGFLGGIGFTMSIFITLLAFDNLEVINDLKIAIMLASLLAGTIGFIFLRTSLKIVPED